MGEVLRITSREGAVAECVPNGDGGRDRGGGKRRYKRDLAGRGGSMEKGRERGGRKGDRERERGREGPAVEGEVR